MFLMYYRYELQKKQGGTWIGVAKSNSKQMLEKAKLQDMRIVDLESNKIINKNLTNNNK